MGRSNRPRRRGRPLKGGPGRSGSGPTQGSAGFRLRGVEHVHYAGQQWSVRHVQPNDSGRVYRCPGCQQEVGANSAHVVVWPLASMNEMDNRRHWHSVCWSARERRRPGGSFA